MTGVRHDWCQLLIVTVTVIHPICVLSWYVSLQFWLCHDVPSIPFMCCHDMPAFSSDSGMICNPSRLCVVMTYQSSVLTLLWYAIHPICVLSWYVSLQFWLCHDVLDSSSQSFMTWNILVLELSWHIKHKFRFIHEASTINNNFPLKIFAALSKQGAWHVPLGLFKLCF